METQIAASNMPRKGKQVSLLSIISIIILLFHFLCIFYSIFFELLGVEILLFVGYICGSLFTKHRSTIPDLLICEALGLGIIGLVEYYVVLLGLASKNLYLGFLLLAAVIVFIKRKTIQKDFQILKKQSFTVTVLNVAFILVSIGIILFFLVSAAKPVSTYDALVKHVTIPVRAIYNGTWDINVTESIVFGETMVLQYTYAIVLFSFGLYKSMQIFNVIIYIFTVVGMYMFSKQLYPKINKWIFLCIFGLTPFFYRYTVVYHIDILSVFFIAIAIMLLAYYKKQIIEHTAAFSILLGFSIFDKLTNVFSCILLALVVAVICAIKCIKDKKFGLLFRKLFLSIGLFILPWIGSFIYIWYYTGNPVYFQYNEFFKSPYFVEQNFTDPYQGNPLGFSFQSLIDIVFHSNEHLEMAPLAMGTYLLLIPIAIIYCIYCIIKKKNLMIVQFTFLALLMYMANTLTTYNIRYYFFTWVILGSIISIVVSALVDCIPRKGTAILNVIMILFLAVPCIKYHIEYPLFFNVFKVESENFIDDGSDILLRLPTGKKVLIVTASRQFTGVYSGFCTSTSWNNYRIGKYVFDPDYNWLDYMRSFDYVIFTNETEEWLMGYRDLISPYLGESIYKNGSNEVFEVIDKLEGGENIVDLDTKAFYERQGMKKNQ